MTFDFSGKKFHCQGDFRPFCDMIFCITLHFRPILEFLMNFDIVRDPCVTFDLSLMFYLYVAFDVSVSFCISSDL